MRNSYSLTSLMLTLIFSSLQFISIKSTGTSRLLPERESEFVLEAPISDFAASQTTIFQGGSVNFFSLAAGVVTSFEWSFPGGNPSSSTLANPTVTYATSGSYSVTLTVANEDGTDTETKVNFIVVAPSFNICASTGSSANMGSLFDSGGPTGNYLNSQSCTFLLTPPCADSIRINIVSFSTESGYDFLRIHDGTGQSAPMIFSASGSTTQTVVIATSGSVFIRWNSDVSVVGSGFHLTWSTVNIESEIVEPQLGVSTTSAAYNVPINFENLTTGFYISTNWNFGDGSTASGAEATHNYVESGIFEVQMQVVLCDTTLTVSQFITIAEAPELEISPEEVSLFLECGRDTTIVFEVSNIGLGELHWSLNELESNPIGPRILALTAGADLAREYPNTIAAINQHVSEFTLVESSSTSATVVATLLEEADIVLLPENESSSTLLYANLAPLLQSFVSEGGWLIQCYPSASQMNATGLITASLAQEGELVDFVFNEPASVFAEGIVFPFSGPNATRFYTITSPDFTSILYPNVFGLQALSMAGYRNIGLGRAFILGVDFFDVSSNAGRLLGNMVNSWLIIGPDWIETTINNGTVAPSDSQFIEIAISSESLLSGNYETELIINTNDLDEEELAIPIFLSITGIGQLDTNEECIDFGNIPVNSYETNGIWLENVGCDTVIISGFEVDSELFEVFSEPTFIVPNDSIWISVGGLVNAEGPFSAQINVLNNATSFSFCLQANGVLSGGVVMNADTLTVNLNSCSDSQSVSVLVTSYNEGTVDVVLETLEASNDLEIGALLFGVDIIQEWQNMLNTINNADLGNFNLTTTNSNSSLVISNFILNKDVIILPEGESSTMSYYTNLGPILSEFVENGGRLIICRQPNSAYYTNLGLFNVSNVVDVATGQTCIVNLSSQYTVGLPANFPAPSSTQRMNVTDVGIEQIVTNNDGLVAFAKPIESGVVFVLGFDYFATNPSTRQLLVNMIASGNPQYTGDLTISPAVSTLQAEEEQLFNITLSSDELLNGQYVIEFGLQVDNQIPFLDTLVVVVNVNGPPCVDFSYTVDCPNIFNFDSEILNEFTSVTWDFGDGSTSNLPAPSHQFETSGSYEVTLTACNDFGCNSSTQIVEVDSDGLLIPPTCTTNNLEARVNYGISNFAFGTISNSTLGGIDDYKDYSCDMITEVIVGDIITFSITTLNTEFAFMWIDFNNDGSFDNTSERFYSNTIASTSHTGSVQIPVTAILNTPLRLRIASDIINLANACSNPFYGQTEDYAIIIVNATSPPVADFIANPLTTIVGQTISFTNLSTGGATSYEWIFEGANISTSALMNPSVTYAATGSYDVTLIATNEFGSDTITKMNYITIQNVINLCSSTTSTNAPSGTLYDSGGPSSNYLNGEYCTFLIQPDCAETITLNVVSFSTESCCDFIRVYDGTSTSGALLWTDSGTPSISTVVANSGSMFIEWDTDGSVTSTGFNLTWTSTLFSLEQVLADFTISEINPALQEEVEFTNASSNAISYLWDFGDGVSSTLSNPTHIYNSSGLFDVSLIALGCGSSDTIVYQIEVQEAPELVIDPSEYTLSLGCSESADNPIVLNNTGGGDLNWNLGTLDNGGVLEILMLTFGTDSFEENQNMINALASSELNYELTQLGSSLASTIEETISNYDVVILPEATSVSFFYGNISNILLEYIEQGGTVIKCAPQSSLELTNLGLFTSTNLSTTFGVGVSVNTTDPITTGFPGVFVAPDLTTFMNVSNIDFVQLISYNGFDVMGYREIGLGRAYLIGFDYFESETNSDLALVRAVEINNGSLDTFIPEWLTIVSYSGTIEAGASQELEFSIDPTGLETGFYSVSIPVNSNDPSNPMEEITINLSINLNPCPSFEIFSSCEGSSVLQSTSVNYESLTWQIEGIGEFTGEVIDIVFPSEGIYEVILEACNEFGCVSDTQLVSILFTSPLSPMSCELSAPEVCCNRNVTSLMASSGIYESSYSINTQNYYTDLSCSDFIYLQQNTLSLLELEFNNFGLYTIFIDYNNNLEFNVNELITSGFNSSVNYGFILPEDVTSGVPLRMRVVLDDSASQISACEAPHGGSVYDFVVFIIGADLLPIPLFSVVDENCSEQKSFINNSLNADTYFWEFGDGNTSSEENPIHTYQSSGSFEVMLTATNEWGVVQTSFLVEALIIEDNIITSGEFLEGSTIDFALNGTYDSYSWEASEGQSSSQAQPTFTFEDPGLQTVSVTVSLGECEETFEIEINLGIVNITDFSDAVQAVLYPNPTNNFAYLELSNYAGESLVVDLLDVTGRLIGPCRKISEGEGTLKYLIEPSVNGVYLIRISDGLSSKTFRLVVSE